MVTLKLLFTLDSNGTDGGSDGDDDAQCGRTTELIRSEVTGCVTRAFFYYGGIITGFQGWWQKNTMIVVWGYSVGGGLKCSVLIMNGIENMVPYCKTEVNMKFQNLPIPYIDCQIFI